MMPSPAAATTTTVMSARRSVCRRVMGAALRADGPSARYASAPSYSPHRTHRHAHRELACPEGGAGLDGNWAGEALIEAGLVRLSSRVTKLRSGKARGPAAERGPTRRRRRVGPQHAGSPSRARKHGHRRGSFKVSGAATGRWTPSLAQRGGSELQSIWRPPGREPGGSGGPEGDLRPSLGPVARQPRAL